MNCQVLKQVGLFDEQFFIYMEDIDLCRRIHEKSATIYYPKCVVKHVHAKESAKLGKMLYYHLQSTLKYFNKWGWLNDKQRKRINIKFLEDQNKMCLVNQHKYIYFTVI